MTPIKPSNGFEHTQDVKPPPTTSAEPKTDQTNEKTSSEEKTDRVFNKTIEQNDDDERRELCIKWIMEEKGVIREVAAAEFDFLN